MNLDEDGRFVIKFVKHLYSGKFLIDAKFFKKIMVLSFK